MPTALLRPSSATAIPVKPIGVRVEVARVDVVPPAEHVDAARQSGEAPGDAESEEVVPRHGDPAVPGGLGIEADRPHLVAERRPVEQQVVDDRARRAR